MEEGQERESPEASPAVTKVRKQIEQAMALWSENRLADAAMLLDSAATTARNDPLLKILMLGSLLSRLGALYIQLADYPKALQVLNEGVSHIEAQFGPESGDLLDFRNNLAAVHMHEGRLEEAKQVLLEVLQGHRNAFPVDRVDVARTLNNLSRVCADLGLLEETQRYIEEAFEILRPRVEPGDSLFTGVLHNLALSHAEAGRLTIASYFYEEAMKNAAFKPNENALERGAIADGLAQLYRKLFRQQEGVELAKLSVSIRSKVLGNQHPEVAASLKTTGLLLEELGSVADALTYLQAAYQVFNAHYGMGHPATVIAILDMLRVSRKAGGNPDTELDLRDMLPLARGPGETANTPLFRVLIDLAVLLAIKHEDQEAQQLAREAARVFHTLPATELTYLRSYCSELAELLFNIGSVDEGLATLESAVSSYDSLVGLTIATRDDAQRRRWLHQLSKSTSRFIRELVAQKLVDSQVAADAAFHFVINRKGLGVEAFLTHDDLALVHTQPELKLLIDSVRDLENELSEIQAAGVLEGVEKRLEKTDFLKRRLREVSLELEARTKPEHQPRFPGFVSTQQIATAIPADTALVEFYAVRRLPDEADEFDRSRREVLLRSGSEAWLPFETAERYVAFVMRQTPPYLRLFDLGDGAEIDKLIHSYLVVLAQGEKTALPHEQQENLLPGSEEELSRALRRRLFDALATSLEGCSTVIVVPDGTVCRLPFGVLLEDGESGRRLIERFTFAYLPTGRLLVPKKTVSDKPGESPLVIGDPDYDVLKPGTSLPESNTPQGPLDFTFSRLAGTADETWQVAQLIGGRRLVGRKASEKAVQECHSPAILHIAAHGYYIRPFADRIMVIGDIKRMGSGSAKFRGQILGYAENPLLRSGIALAGANAWGRKEPLPEDLGDGLLSSVEVAHLDLKLTELVVLSACSTALGDVTPGEGVAGLLQAVRLAGSNATAAALWQIPDESTVALMTRFYEKLMGNMAVSPVTALREAQLDLLRTGKPPSQWGAFVCYGGMSSLVYRPQ